MRMTVCTTVEDLELIVPRPDGDLDDEAYLAHFFATVGDDRSAPRLTQVRLRDFEVPMSAGFYLAEHSDELADFFTPGVEIETWRTRAELLEKCRHYLIHDGPRRAIATAGRARALREHTWEHRFTAAFSAMGLV